jgi:hypothetical protein
MRVQYWGYNDGWKNIPEVLRKFNNGAEKEFEEWLVGWHCWGYEHDGDNIAQWMKENMKGEYECDFRFNSGDPMHTIHIREAADATLFKLRWM